MRAQKVLSQKEMAKQLRISYSHYVKVENDFVKPSFELLKRIKDHFDEVDMNDFFK
ncbi:helix-turn-helix domain-containing protein [Lapidilactobacillus luobeiensis]|uniref:helix-turn-helix domain-containing protein n=1 Tax=Lapidilactobacillus luobeiensis TaxID=2950371 RepID=UPI0035A24FA3